ncbi:MAG TPA: hypothetical protein VFZ34_11660 [Blastocatellia bacterium]|nr:hypothetical protein [Blastocatellia bacterium]
MKKRTFLFSALALIAIALGLSTQFTAPLSVSAQEPETKSVQEPEANKAETWYRTLVVDVACDATTFRLNKSGTIMDARRGDGFMVQGKIYPGYTIPRGGTMENPGPFDPRIAPGSTGQWVCRGTFSYDIGEILQGAEPHLFSTQYHLFNDGRGIVHDGPEGGGTQIRAILGGMGPYAGFTGEVIEEPLGVNATGLFNIRFTFKFKQTNKR